MSTETTSETTTEQKQSPEQKQPAQTQAETRADKTADSDRREVDGDGYSAAFKAMQADVSRLQGEVQSRDRKIAEMQRELEKVGKERGDLAGQIERFSKMQQEAKLVGRVREQVPGASDLAIRGMLAALHEEGALDRYAPDDKLEETAKLAVEKIKPAIGRPPAQGGGPGGAPPQQKVTTRDPLTAFFGPVQPKR